VQIGDQVGGQVGGAVAGIDPHKRSATVAVLSGVGGLVASASFAMTAAGIAALAGWLVEVGVPLSRIGVEGSAGLGMQVATALGALGYDVREVPANRTALRRRRRTRAKSDTHDAIAIAREVLADADLPPAGKHAQMPGAWQELSALHAWRASEVKARRRLLNEAEAVLTGLSAPVRDLLPDTRSVARRLGALTHLPQHQQRLSGGDVVRVRRALAIAARVAAADAVLKDLQRQAKPLLAALGCTLTSLPGVGVVAAMTLLAEIGDPTRFATEGAFARWCGIAPLEISSGEGDTRPLRHRLDLGGNRAVNSVLHIMHVTQARTQGAARDYLTHRLDTRPGQTPRMARRAHKRLLANVIIRRMWRDARTTTQPTTTTQTPQTATAA
jgi:transposase